MDASQWILIAFNEDTEHLFTDSDLKYNNKFISSSCTETISRTVNQILFKQLS